MRIQPLTVQVITNMSSFVDPGLSKQSEILGKLLQDINPARSQEIPPQDSLSKRLENLELK